MNDERVSFDESFRVLRSNLRVALADIGRPTVVVTSANPTEGKTLVAANLAVAFAASGLRVVLVDLDLRHPNAHRLIGAHNEYGASEVLLGWRTLKESMQFVEVPGPSGHPIGLYFLSTGTQVSNPAELLGVSRSTKLLDQLGSQADLVLLDSPPVLPVADTLVIGRISSGAILVAESRKTALPALQKAKDLLIRNQTRLLGVVLNKFRNSDADYSFGYGYGYGAPQEGPATQSLGHTNGSQPSPVTGDDLVS